MKDVTADELVGMAASLTTQDCVRLLRTTLERIPLGFHERENQFQAAVSLLLETLLVDQSLGKRLRDELTAEISTMTIGELQVIRMALAGARSKHSVSEPR